MKVKTALQQFAVWVQVHTERGQRGSSVIEYVLLVSLIAIVCLIAVTHLGKGTSTVYSRFNSSLQTYS